MMIKSGVVGDEYTLDAGNRSCLFRERLRVLAGDEHRHIAAAEASGGGHRVARDRRELAVSAAFGDHQRAGMSDRLKKRIAVKGKSAIHGKLKRD